MASGQFPKLTKLRYFRRKERLYQRELARRAGISMETVSRIERGETGAKYETQEELAKVLGVDPDKLL
jgi:transcriptional regulator with XRE-family HTH domain